MNSQTRGGCMNTRSAAKNLHRKNYLVLDSICIVWGGSTRRFLPLFGVVASVYCFQGEYFRVYVCQLCLFEVLFFPFTTCCECVLGSTFFSVMPHTDIELFDKVSIFNFNGSSSFVFISVVL